MFAAHGSSHRCTSPPRARPSAYAYGRRPAGCARHVGIREGQLQPDQPADRPPHQVREGGRGHRRRGRQRRTSSRATRSTPTPTSKRRRTSLRTSPDPHNRYQRVRAELRHRPALSDPALLPRSGGEGGARRLRGHPGTIRSMDMVAIGRVVLTSREHIIALEPLSNGLMGTLLRYPYEVRDEKDWPRASPRASGPTATRRDAMMAHPSAP